MKTFFGGYARELAPLFDQLNVAMREIMPQGRKGA
jgi:hypothetical protein